MTFGLLICRVGSAVGFLTLEVECRQAGVTKCDIFHFIVVEEWPLTEPRRLEAALQCLLLPERTFCKVEVHWLVWLVRLRDAINHKQSLHVCMNACAV